MIESYRGDILKAKADALVNTVNCVGVMGRGIALQFKKAFPEVFKVYESACKRGEIQPGTVLTCDLNRLDPPHYVINVPTKKHWRSKSKLEYVEAGLDALVDEVQRLGLKSIAIPPLGSGLGGLDWNEVRPRIERAFEALPEVQVYLYEPTGAPSPEEMASESKAPNMTEGRALLLGLMKRYLAAVMDPTVSLLEIHKLMYLMQESGQDLKLKFEKGTYGPYGKNLRHVLTHIEGHFITGYGDAADDPTTPIEPKPEAIAIADAFLDDHPQVHEQFDRVVCLIDGYETPFGMELLSTVHWVGQYEGAKTADEAAEKTYAWGDRKRMFRREHIDVAWEALCRQGWLNQAN